MWEFETGGSLFTYCAISNVLVQGQFIPRTRDATHGVPQSTELLENFGSNRTARVSCWKQKAAHLLAVREQVHTRERAQGLPSITILILGTKFTVGAIRVLILQLYLVPWEAGQDMSVHSGICNEIAVKEWGGWLLQVAGE